jgi:hypothetical protein
MVLMGKINTTVAGAVKGDGTMDSPEKRRSMRLETKPVAPSLILGNGVSRASKNRATSEAYGSRRRFALPYHEG